MNTPQEVANEIKSVAKSKNITVAKMLKDCTLNKDLISTTQSKNFYPRIEAICKIADYLDCSVDYLLGRSDNPDSHKNSMREKNQPVLVYRAARSDDHDGAEMAPPSREHLETIVQAPEDDVKSAEQKPQE